MKKIILILVILLFATQCFAQFQALIKVPEKLTKLNLSVEVMEVMQATNSRFTDDPAWNTRVYEGYKIINFKGDTTYPRLQAFIANTKLDWEILAANDGQKEVEIEVDGVKTMAKVTNTLKGYDPAILINYIQRDRIYKDGKLLEEIEPKIIEFGRYGGMPILLPMEVK